MKDINKELIVEFIDMIMGTVFLYGPVDENDILDIIEEKCQNRYEMCYSLYGSILENLSKNNLEKRDEYYSAIPFEQLDEIQAVIGYNREEIMNVYGRKDFSTEEIKSYADIFHSGHHNCMAQLADFINDLDFSDELKDDMYKLGIVSAISLGAFESYDDILSQNTEQSYDREKLLIIYDELIRIIPRGIFNGYSLAELGMNETTEKAEHRIRVKEKADYPHFSYQQCQKLAEKVKNTDLFENINANSLLQFYINGEYIYCFLIGRYSKDKGIAIMNENNVYYNSYLLRNSESYPDLIFRADQICVFLEKTEYLAETFEKEIKENGYSAETIFIRMNMMKPENLADEKDTDIIGAVFTELLRLDEDGNYDLTDDSDEIVNQIYVYDDHIEYGNYNDYSFFDVHLPFKTRKLTKKNIEKISACENDFQISIGLYSSENYEEETEGYIYLCYIADTETCELIDMLMFKPDAMTTAVNDVARVLIENDIKPYMLTFNNLFTFEVFKSFTDVVDDIEINAEMLNQVNEMFNEMLNRQQEETLLS